MVAWVCKSGIYPILMMELSGLHSGKSFRIIGKVQKGETRRVVRWSRHRCCPHAVLWRQYATRDKADAGCSLASGVSCRSSNQQHRWVEKCVAKNGNVTFGKKTGSGRRQLDVRTDSALVGRGLHRVQKELKRLHMSLKGKKTFIDIYGSLRKLDALQRALGERNMICLFDLNRACIKVSI